MFFIFHTMRIYILSAFFIITFSVKSQVDYNRTDSLSVFTSKAAFFIKKDNKDSALYYYDKAIALAEQKTDSIYLVELYIKKATLFELSGKYLQSLTFFYKALSLQKDGLENQEIGLCYLGLSNINFRIANNSTAMEQGIKAANIFEHIKDTTNLIASSMLIGQVYIGLEKYDEAFEIYKNALKLCKKLKYNKSQIADIINHLGAIYTFQHQYKLALEQYFIALKINKEINNNINLSIDHANIGEAYMYLGDYTKALFHLNQGMEIGKNENFTSLLIFINYVMGQTFTKMNEYEKAFSYYSNSLDLIAETGELREKPTLYKLISEHYALKKDFNQALTYYKKYSSLTDSLKYQTSLQKVDELKIRYEVDKKEQEYKAFLLDKELHKNALQSKSNSIKMQRIILIVVVFSLMGSIISTLYIYRNRKKLKKLIETKRVIFSIIGHDLRGPVANVKQLVAMLQEADSNEAKEEFIKALTSPIESAHDLLEELLAWSKSVDNTTSYNPEPIALKGMVDDIIILLHSAIEKKKIALASSITDDISAYADKYHVSAILRNLISNAIKFTPENGSIRVSHQVEKGLLKVKIKDTGVGISPQNISKILNPNLFFTSYGTQNEKGTGLGLVITQNFININKGDFWIDSEIGKGSSFYFTLPIDK